MVTEQEGALLVRKFTDSNLSERKFCRENGIKRSTLRYWIERLAELSDGKEVYFSKLVLGGENKCYYPLRKDIHILGKH